MSLIMFSEHTGRSKVSKSKSGSKPVEKFVKEDQAHIARQKALEKKKGKKEVKSYPYEKSSEGKVYRHPKE